MRGSGSSVRWRLSVGLAALALVAGACSGGGEEETEDTVALEDIEPIVDIDPCELIDDETASALSGADVEAAESTTDDDGTTTCDFAFADADIADSTGSAIAASLSIGPGDESDVPSGSSVARTLSMGDASAVEEEDDKVRVVYIVREVVVRVEIVPGDGEISEELIDEVVEFTETTEAPITEAVTGEPFVDDETTTTGDAAPTTTFVDEDIPEGPRIDIGDTATLTVERAGGEDNAVFEGEAGDAIFVEIPAATRDQADGTECLTVRIIHPQDFSVTGTCALVDGTAFVDRIELDVTGFYQILFDPDGTATGEVEVEITNAGHEEGTIEVDGDTETLTVTEKGGISTVEFEAEEGDAIFVSIPAATRDLADGTECLTVRIIHPQEFSITGICALEDGTAFIDRVDLDTDGTYQIMFDPDGRATGSVDVQLTAAD